MISVAMAIAGDPALGWTIGMTAPTGMLQLVGRLVETSTTLRHAWTTLCRFLPLLAEGVMVELSERNGDAKLTFRCSVRNTDGARFAADYALATVMRTAHSFVGAERARVKLLSFEHAVPAQPELVTSTCDCAVLWGQPVNALVFARDCLDVPQRFADALTYEALEGAAETLMGDRPSRVVERARDILTVASVPLSISELALRLGLSPRSLRRRLARDGTSYTQLMHETRRRAACDAIAKEEASTHDVAEQLGFSERSAFQRAFKRWTGLPPGAYRRIERNKRELGES